MFTAIVYIAIAVLVIAVFITAIKLFVAIFPYLLVGGIICLVILAFSATHSNDDKCTSPSTQYQTVPQQEEIPSNSEESDYMFRNENQALYHKRAIAQVYHKEGVNLASLQPAMDSAIFVIRDAFEQILGPYYIPTITSGDDYDGHCEGSAHYSGAALDFRLKDIDDPEFREAVAFAVREKLDDRFFVDHEAPDQENEHLHVQLRQGTYRKVAWR